MTPDRATDHRAIAELLPWWVNGTLDAEEARRVEEHLEHCEPCRRQVVLLSELDEAVTDGADQAVDLPAAASVTPADAAWSPDASRSAPPRRASWAAWTGWAAAAVLTVALGLQGRLERAPGANPSEAPAREQPASTRSRSLGVVSTYRLDAVRRSADATVTVPASPEFQLLLHVDLGPGALPLELDLRTVDGHRVLHRTGLRNLYEGRFLFLHCTAEDVPPGRYRLTLRGQGPDAPDQPLLYSFRVVGPGEAGSPPRPPDGGARGR